MESLFKINIDNIEKETNDLLNLCRKKTMLHDVAIIGICVKTPSANNLEQFWNNLRNGKSAIKAIPKVRKEHVKEYLDYINYDDTAIVYPKGGYLDNIHYFDYSFFNISPKEASLMDPNQRLFLEIAWGAIEDSGYGGNKLIGTKTGVYVGYGKDSEYREMIKKVEPDAVAVSIPGNIRPMIASRISYLLDLKGPSMLVNTSCSSSLVAIHLACKALRNKECDLAIAGSIKIKILPFDNEVKVGIEAADGNTRTFDDASDGTGGGEGIAAIILKPLEKAIEDKDNIYAVIKGSAVNQDGKSAGITAPNPLAQEEVIVSAWKDAEIDPETITYIEAHGTGTRLGDPIEVEGITRAFRRFTERKQFCSIGSVKSNLGHLDNAAGIAGLIKAVMSLKYKEIPPTLHFRRPNRNIAFETSPVFVNHRLLKWEINGVKRRCGVSAFGLSGTNCHIVLEEAPAIEDAPAIQETSAIQEVAETGNITTELITISARSKEALKELIGRYCAFLSKEDKASLKDVSYTLNTGRGHYEYRLALPVASRKELKDKLEMLFELEEYTSNLSEKIYYGQHKIVDESKHERASFEITEAERKNITIEADTLTKKIAETPNEELQIELCRLYVEGAQVQWANIYVRDERRILSIPTYPFEKKECWLEVPKGKVYIGNDSITDLLGGKALPEQLYKQIKELISNWKVSTKQINETVNSEPHYTIKALGREGNKYSNTEKKLVQLWGSILGFQEINVFDNFFELGGDSLIAMRIVNHAKEDFNFNIKVEDIIKYPSVQELSKHIESGIIDDVNFKEPSICKAAEREYYPLSSAQKRMFILNRIDSDQTSYNIPSVMLIKGKLTEDKIKLFNRVFHELITRHEGLRTSFCMQEGQPVQRIHKKVEFSINIIEAKDANIDDTIQKLIRPFDLNEAPLFRISIVRISADRSLLVSDIHHIISDGASMKLLVEEFIELCNGNKLKQINIQYKDYAIWQISRQTSVEYKEQRDYWNNRFTGNIPMLNMTFDFERPNVQSFEGDKIGFYISKEQSGEIGKLAQKMGTTIYMLLMSMLYVLLYRYTDQEDIIIGTLVNGRTHAEIEGIVGMFVNTLAIRNNPSKNKTFTEFLLEVRKNMMEAYSNQDYQYEELIDTVGIDRDISRNPLIDIVFNYISSPTQRIELADLEIESYEFNTKKSIFDITVTATDGTQGIRIDFEYCNALYKMETIQGMIDCFQTMILDVLEEPTKKLMDIKLMNENRLSEVLVEFNPTKVDYPYEKTIHELFEERVIMCPNQIAVEYEDSSLTYIQLNERANQLAHKLRNMGVGRECIVGVLMERSVEMIIGIMAILKAGGAYLPIDPAYPEERIDFLIKDSGTKITLSMTQLMDKAKLCENVIDLENEASYEADTTNLYIINEPKDLAYIIYTSGTTGMPKGVMIEHTNVVNTLTYLERSYPLGTSDAFLLKTSFCFDVSVTELFGFFFGKGKVVILKQNHEKDPKTILKAIKERGITHINFVPSMLEVFLNAITEEEQKVVNQLKYLFSAGEAIKKETVTNFLMKYDHVKLENLYGPTEATIYATKYSIRSVPGSVNVPIGQAIQNVSCYVLDYNQECRPIGVPGELYISGKGLARGYLNREELNTEKFIKNPFDLNERMYRTGDLVRWLPNGTIEYLGRMDHQVKIRGFRIELEEISSNILKYEAVKDVVVIDCKTKHGDIQLCAYIVVDHDIVLSGLKEYLLMKLPSYMVPAYYIILDRIPLSFNGKVDRKQLPDPFENAILLEEYCAPTNEVQQRIYSIWVSILGVERIGIYDNFFDIGGNSLTLIEMESQLNEHFNNKIKVTDIFKYPTISKLSSYIQSSQNEPIKEVDYKDKVLDMFKQFENGEIDMNDLVDRL